MKCVLRVGYAVLPGTLSSLTGSPIVSAASFASANARRRWRTPWPINFVISKEPAQSTFTLLDEEVVSMSKCLPVLRVMVDATFKAQEDSTNLAAMHLPEVDLSSSSSPSTEDEQAGSLHPVPAHLQGPRLKKAKQRFMSINDSKRDIF